MDILSQKSHLRYVFRAVLFLMISLTSFLYLTNLLRDKTGDSSRLSTDDSTQYDVIFLGASRINDAVYPMQLYGDYGFASFNNAQSGEMLPVTYWSCKNVIENHHPKILVLDLGGLAFSYNYGSLSYTHYSLDTLPFINRTSAILDIVEKKDQLEFFLPIFLFHNRWKELSAFDFTQTNYLLKGCGQLFTPMAEDMVGVTVDEIPENIKLQPHSHPVEYLDKIVKLCKDTGTELVLVAIPGLYTGDYVNITEKGEMPFMPRYANWANDYADEKGLNYINYYHLIDELGFDWVRHMHDRGHVNYYGGVLVTDYLGQYLVEHYDLPDRRDDPDYALWNIDLEQYKVRVNAKLEELK